MLRILPLAVMIFALGMAPLWAKAAKNKDEKPKPYPVLDQKTLCDSEGGFGRRFLRQRSGETQATAEEDWAPFTRLTIGYREIRAEASFRGAGESQEDDEAAATKFRKAFEKSDHGFARHKAHSNGTEYESDDKAGVSFLIRQDQEHVTAICRSQDR